MNIRHNHTILLVDDDRDDLQMLQEAVRQLNSSYNLEEATDGEQGFSRLQLMKKEGRLPCLIVLDINMPKLDGRQTFRLIRSDTTLSRIPVVIFSTSSSELDKLFFKGDNVAYITKPVEFSNLLSIAKKMLEYCGN